MAAKVSDSALKRVIVAKIAYAILFTLVLPALLIAWARATEPVIAAPAAHAPMAGRFLVIAGATLIVAGWAALWTEGGGLPMNAFPPPRFATRGAFRWMPHPIYTGFVAMCFGVSIAFGSASGLWLVSPATLLACVALVEGHERWDLRRRFGDAATVPWVALPPPDASSPPIAERLAGYVTTIVPWVVLYELLARVVPPDTRDAHFAWEAHLPLWQASEVPYAATYLLVGLAPLAARTRRDLRTFIVRVWLAMALAFPMYLVVPLVSPPRPFAPHGVLGAVLEHERVWDTPACSFPSFHVVWAFIAADAWASRTPRRRFLWRSLACLVAVSCVTTGMHAIIDVAGGLAAFGLVAHHDAVWRVLRGGAERIANSWREVRLGPVRLINHGAWAALGTFGGVAAIGALIGPAHIAAILIAATASLVGAALWAQLVEGSPSLSRPYGFYGGLLGVVVGSLAAPLVGTPVWPLVAAYTVVAPWVQACGRLRCLVQGCCHGRETSPAVGIRYTHPRSRVVRLANLADVPLHPTPLYSILWNVATATVVVRLWSLHARWHLIAGVYLILNGLGRFVEEAFRGEPQTPTVARLRLYQWTAVVSVAAGALVTAWGESAPAPALQPNPASVIAAAAFGIVTWVALGLDFPESSARFSRLA